MHEFNANYDLILNFTGTIIASWFISPVMSGCMSVGLYMLINRFILKTRNPLKSGLWSLPIFYGVTLFVNLFSIIHDGPECKLRFSKFFSYFLLFSLKMETNNIT